jgi:hypothetical protein
MCRSGENPFEQIRAGLDRIPAWLSSQPPSAMGQVSIDCQQIINRAQAASAEAIRRFEKSGAYKSDGALGIVPWLRDKAKLSGGDAAVHVQVARQLEQLPRTEEALSRGEINYQHAVAMARTAEHVGVGAVRKAEATLLKSAETMDAGRFVDVVKDFEHRVDADAAVHEANRAHARRYLTISEPVNGLAHIEGQLVAEAAATIRSAMEPFMKPRKGDERTSGQRMHDALVYVCRSAGPREENGAGPRPQLLIKVDLDTLAGLPGAAAGRLQWGGTIPTDTVRRLACDSAITRITGLGELEHEITHSTRTIPAATRRALVVRDQHCVFPGCDRPAAWCDAHHVKFWADGGSSKLENLCLLCEAHHRKVHEEGWRLERRDRRWVATPPRLKIVPHPRT